jgi:predicted transposase
MKLIAQVKLLPTKEQAALLRATLERANDACTSISRYAWEHQTFRQFNLHHALYRTIKDDFALAAQMVVRCLAKVADSYKLSRETQRIFKRRGAIAYDARILSYDTANQSVSIWTLQGRQRIAYAVGTPQQQLLESQRGESDLIYRRGAFYLLAVCDVEDVAPELIDEVIGVDFGIVNIATTSDGQSFSGQEIERSRQWYASRRCTLQSVGTRSAKRRLRWLSGNRNVSSRIRTTSSASNLSRWQKTPAEASPLKI